MGRARAKAAELAGRMKGSTSRAALAAAAVAVLITGYLATRWWRKR